MEILKKKSEVMENGNISIDEMTFWSDVNAIFPVTWDFTYVRKGYGISLIYDGKVMEF